ncbi:MAG: hypothetical protein UH654_05005 [Lachnospiraceae bacterium]|uniref:hypothetical protein n=1 Tax=Falcatimonas sp. MSJ-15 TaxID=2841515 RepID=UPI001C0FECB4|nr:hypothetical protein [Falcatimonas sp. MSJ-15]MBQ5735873.1 hypothetical protein [Lachnospiraceae bacterium]MBU5469100.1 hypothetical protein [Falcatimonas sp. MSJ-15]MEE0959373.1 hypothetical protein [Lachnospiraceae bacterium]
MIEREDLFLRYFNDVKSLLMDIFQSGFDTIGEGTVKEIEHLRDVAIRCGMSSLSKLFDRLIKTVREDMHSIDSGESITMVYFQILQYIDYAQNKVMYDKAEKIY